jgi:hypothetical protein
MDDAPLNSVVFVLSWYQQNVDARAKEARFEIGPDGNPTGRMIIMHECGLPDQAVSLDFVRACLTFKDWRLNSRKKWTTTHKFKNSGMSGAILAEEDAARLEHRSPSMSNVLSIFRSQKPRLSYDRMLLLFDEVFSAYLKAVGRQADWRW